MRLVLATRSADKLREIRQIFGPALPLLSLDDVGLAEDPAEDALETFDTFRENALAKARYFAGRLGGAVLADDSGLEVAALGGRPGVRTKRFARDAAEAAGVAFAPGPGGNDVANNALLLERLSGVSEDRRHARYVCAAALVIPADADGIGGFSATSLGTCSGIIARAPRGSGGFGYDPLFLLPEIGRTMAEIEPHEKHAVSHRARAFRALAPTTSELLNRG